MGLGRDAGTQGRGGGGGGGGGGGTGREGGRGGGGSKLQVYAYTPALPPAEFALSDPGLGACTQ